MQVDPVKLNLKPPGTERLKVQCDDPLSDFAFNFNLRRYVQALVTLKAPLREIHLVRRCRLILSTPR